MTLPDLDSVWTLDGTCPLRVVSLDIPHERDRDRGALARIGVSDGQGTTQTYLEHLWPPDCYMEEGGEQQTNLRKAAELDETECANRTLTDVAEGLHDDIDDAKREAEAYRVALVGFKETVLRMVPGGRPSSGDLHNLAVAMQAVLDAGASS